MTVWVVRPDNQSKLLIALFQGARAPHPAAALAGWKMATRDSLGKPLEAVISLGNPEMVREFATMDGTRAAIRFDRADGRAHWDVVVPRDEGTARALATALVLTGGGTEPPLDGVSVDRLGPPGAPVSAETGGRFLLAGSRDDLAAAIHRRDVPVEPVPSEAAGLHFRVDPLGLANSSALQPRRLAEALQAARCLSLEASFALRGETIAFDLSGRLDSAPPSSVHVDPSWLDWVPATTALAVVSIALDPRPETWDQLFNLADRVERLDPARAGLAPLRTRLNLIALAAKVRLESDFWPVLRGLTIATLADPQGDVSGTVLLLHTSDATAAARIEETVVPRLTASWVRGNTPAVAGTRSLGKIFGRPLSTARQGPTVLIGWGETALASVLEAKEHPDASAGRALRNDWAANLPQRAGAFWPGRLRAVAPAGSVLAITLAEAPPIVWHGRNEASTIRDQIRWSGLRELVRKFLERIPFTSPGSEP